VPACLKAAITSAGGQPKVKLTIGGGSASRQASFSSKPSSSQVASPSETPTAAALERSEPRYAEIAATSADGVPGTNTFTPNGSAVPARTAAISATMAAGVR
jgi:hypothetical protein